ncbi:8622_t:CDS:10, partial [Diversispora eburnea]
MELPGPNIGLSPRNRQPLGSFSQTLQYTKSPNMSRSYLSSHNIIEIDRHPSYSASPFKIRTQTLALADLANSDNSDEDDSYKIDSSINPIVDPVDPNVTIKSQRHDLDDPKGESRPLLSNNNNKSWYEWLPCVGGDGGDQLQFRQNSVQFTPQAILQNFFLNPISYIPAVILGLLLNLLDAISYGMITFPISNDVFADFGPDGISMFFVSIFGGGNGSMMIEVVPFLHIMADIIAKGIGDDRDAIIATTILSFALSSILTGVVFLLLGAFKLGSLIEFFPRHILVGCIGGVGWFLFATAIEVTALIEGNLKYNLETLKYLFLNAHIFALWTSALGLAILLRMIHMKFNHDMVVPFYFMIIPLLFYFVVYNFDLDWNNLRETGWVFPMPKGDVPWNNFYSHYDFSKTNWSVLLQTVPAMFALTFFGILHVPINIPALGVSLNEDNVNTNRELIAHGLSNMFSGMVGSVQNYLVYTNSVLFYKSGGGNRVAGLMLAAGTAIILFIGPWIVGYVPIMVVGALIFHLGLELMKEALIDTWHTVNRMEYFTITVIVIFMALLGFIEGIFIGIIMACIFFVVSNSSKNPIRATFFRSSIKSTVRRRYCQQQFLKKVGNQVYAIRLQGYMFFGTTNKVETAIRHALTLRQWIRNPIRFLIVDFSLVTGFDYSAAETFIKIQRLLQTKNVYLVICGALYNSEVGKALRVGGIWGENPKEFIQIFENFDEALEWCENMLLQAYYSLRSSATTRQTPPKEIFNVSPRHKLVQAAGRVTLHEERPRKYLSKATKILIEAFQDITDKNEEFFNQLAPYFHEIKVPAGVILWKQDERPDCLYLVEKGILRATWRATEGEHAKPVESILPGTLAGELGFFAQRDREATLVAENECTLWKMTESDFMKLPPKVANDFMRLALNFSAERLGTMT